MHEQHQHADVILQRSLILDHQRHLILAPLNHLILDLHRHIILAPLNHFILDQLRHLILEPMNHIILEPMNLRQSHIVSGYLKQLDIQPYEN